MRLAIRLACLSVAAVMLAMPCSAEVWLTPFVGTAFGRQGEDMKLAYGGALAFVPPKGVGFEMEFGRSPSFFDGPGLEDQSLTTLVGNLVFTGGSTHVRFYGALGGGLFKPRVRDAAGFFNVDSNEFGLDVGGGAIYFPNRTVGIRGDLRYFRNLTDPEPDNEFDVTFGGLRFWRLSGGVTLRF